MQPSGVPLARCRSNGPTTTGSQADRSYGNAYLYILTVVSFYGVFLCGIMLGYFRSKRREKRRTNVFTRLVHEEEEREWGTWPRKPSVPLYAFPSGLCGVRAPERPLPFSTEQPQHQHQPPPPGGPYEGRAGGGPYEGRVLSPLACAICLEQSSVSSLCSSADVHFAIEEESDSAATEDSEEAPKRSSEEAPKRSSEPGYHS
ncbi:hypothetical protein NHX12_008731 [Muraenolepis orangiensis]|uniref:Potassium voltage-gated channel subfamily E member 4 n=1 Tax=Muraenolepis orangiensis TaxID=630683 RepID=A0A9Q0DLW9_9TELE|nr:hypothetical protein NHX12_008731 [Muraenolepis orangiensis]